MTLELKDIKARIRRHRTMSNTPISELARIGGVSESTIRRYDDPSDPREPSLFVMAKICAHYGLSMDWLVFGPTDTIAEEVRFRMVLDNLSTRLPLESQLAFTTFIQGVYDYALQMGRDGAPLVDLQVD